MILSLGKPCQIVFKFSLFYHLSNFLSLCFVFMNNERWRIDPSICLLRFCIWFLGGLYFLSFHGKKIIWFHENEIIYSFSFSLNRFNVMIWKIRIVAPSLRFTEWEVGLISLIFDRFDGFSFSHPSSNLILFYSLSLSLSSLNQHI